MKLIIICFYVYIILYFISFLTRRFWYMFCSAHGIVIASITSSFMQIDRIFFIIITFSRENDKKCYELHFSLSFYLTRLCSFVRCGTKASPAIDSLSRDLRGEGKLVSFEHGKVQLYIFLVWNCEHVWDIFCLDKSRYYEILIIMYSNPNC